MPNQYNSTSWNDIHCSSSQLYLSIASMIIHRRDLLDHKYITAGLQYALHLIFSQYFV